MNLFIKALDIICQKFDIILAVLKCFELQVDEFFATQLVIHIDIHLLIDCGDQSIIDSLAGGRGLGVHEVGELLAVQIVVRASVCALRLVVLVEGESQVLLEECVVLTAIRLFLVLVSGTGSLSPEDLVWIQPVRALLHGVVVDGGRDSAMVGEACC